MEQKTKICPYCGETILAVAKKCRYCGEWLDDSAKPSTTSTPTTESEKPTDNPNHQQEQIVSEGQVEEQNPSELSSVAATQSTAKTTSSKSVLRRHGQLTVIALIALLLVGGCVWYYVHQKAVMKEHQDAVAYFEENAKEIKTNALAIRRVSGVILYDIYKNWHSAIFDHYAYNSNNDSVYCRDFNDAIGWRTDYYTKKDVYYHLNQWTDTIESMMKNIQNPPDDKHKEILEKLNLVYYKAEEVSRLCNQPYGNLNSFSSKYKDLLSELDNAIKGTDLVIGNVDEYANILYNSAMGSYSLQGYIKFVLSQ